MSFSPRSPVIATNPSGTRVPLSVDALGRLITTVSGAGSGGTSATDQDTFTEGVSAGTPMMGEGGGDLLIVAVNPATRALLVEGSLSVAPVTSNVSNSPALNTISTTAEEVLAANSDRVKMILQNVGTTRLYIGFGVTPTVSNYHIALPASGEDHDGSSPLYVDMTWIGAVNAISSASGGLIQVTEME